MNRGSTLLKRTLILATGVAFIAIALGLSAQVQTTTTSTQTGPHVLEVQVERAEVLYVSGNELVVRMEDGTVRHIANVPESAKVMVDGKELGLHDLKPGMKLQRTIVTTATPKVITTVQTVTGKVWQITPPNSVILTLENGQNERFKIPSGQKFTVNGQETDAWGLKKGMVVSATKIVEEPVTVVAERKRLTGEMPSAPPAPPAGAPILVASNTPPPAVPAAPAAAEATPAALPATGSQFPLSGLLGCTLLLGALSLRIVRRIAK